MHASKVVSGIAATSLAALLALGAVSVRAGEQRDVSAMIENAKTAADHEAIAAYYDQQAAGAREQAERHREMEQTYTRVPAIGKGGSARFPQHCATLVKHYEGAAREYETLAAAHRAMAKEAE